MINNKKKTAFLAAAVFLSTSFSAAFAAPTESTNTTIKNEQTEEVGANTFAERIRNIIDEYNIANGRYDKSSMTLLLRKNLHIRLPQRFNQSPNRSMITLGSLVMILTGRELHSTQHFTQFLR